jgi:hypothetical protein
MLPRRVHGVRLQPVLLQAGRSRIPVRQELHCIEDKAMFLHLHDARGADTIGHGHGCHYRLVRSTMLSKRVCATG